MLSTDDAAVVARDPALPGLATVLDGDRLAERLVAARPDLRIEAAAAEYVRYKPATSCLVQHRIVVAGREHWLTAKAFTPQAAGKARKLAAGASPTALGPGGVLLDDECAAVLLFPNDAALPLPTVLRPETRPAALRRLVADHPAHHDAEATMLSHRPERRFVARLDAPGHPSLVVKGYSDDRFAQARRASKAFASATEAGVAARLGASARHRLLAFGWVAGRPLDAAWAQEDVAPGVLADVGVLLARFQRRPSRHLSRLDRATEALRVLAAAQFVATTVPPLAHRVRAAAASVAQDLLALPPQHRAVHGDFSADQVVLGPDPVIIDYDAAAIGDPATDLGHFTASAIAAVIAGALDGARAQAGTAALLDGHAAEAGPTPPARVALYRAAWLLRLAPEPFRRRWASWVADTERLVEAAAR